MVPTKLDTLYRFVSRRLQPVAPKSVAAGGPQDPPRRLPPPPAPPDELASSTAALVRRTLVEIWRAAATRYPSPSRIQDLLRVAPELDLLRQCPGQERESGGGKTTPPTNCREAAHAVTRGQQRTHARPPSPPPPEPPTSASTEAPAYQGSAPADKTESSGTAPSGQVSCEDPHPPVESPPTGDDPGCTPPPLGKPTAQERENRYLKDCYFNELEALIGVQHEVDAFCLPSAVNSHCPESWSDAFAQKWEGRKIWLHPPYNHPMIAKTIRHALEAYRDKPDATHLTLMVPIWPSQTWYGQLRSSPFRLRKIYPTGAPLFKDHRGVDLPGTRWPVGVFTLSGADKNPPAHLPPSSIEPSGAELDLLDQVLSRETLSRWVDPLELDTGDERLQQLVLFAEAIGAYREDATQPPPKTVVNREMHAALLLGLWIDRHLRRLFAEPDTPHSARREEFLGALEAGPSSSQSDLPPRHTRDRRSQWGTLQPDYSKIRSVKDLRALLEHWPALSKKLCRLHPAKWGTGVHVLSLGTGIGGDIRALVLAGVRIRKISSSEVDRTARQGLWSNLLDLHAQYPKLLPRSAFDHLHDVLPYDATRITRRHLQRIGPVDVFTTGFPCQSLSPAGRGLGVGDPRLKLFMAMVWTLLQLQTLQGPASFCYLLECVTPDSARTPAAQEFWALTQELFGTGVVNDAAAMGAFSHRRRWWATNGMPEDILQGASNNLQRDPTLDIKSVLKHYHSTQVCTQPDHPSFYPVNKVGETIQCLPTVLAFLYSKMYRLHRPGMLHRAGTSLMDRPDAEETEGIMSYPAGSTGHTGLTDEERCSLLGNAWNPLQAGWLFQQIQDFQSALCEAPSAHSDAGSDPIDAVALVEEPASAGLYALEDPPECFAYRAVCNGHSLLLLLDSGASDSYLRHSLPQKLKANQIPLVTPGSVRYANGEQCSYTHVAELKLHLGGHTFVEHFKPINLHGYDGILGMRWLKKHRPRIDWTTGKMTIRSSHGAQVVLHPVNSVKPATAQAGNKDTVDLVAALPAPPTPPAGTDPPVDSPAAAHQCLIGHTLDPGQDRQHSEDSCAQHAALTRLHSLLQSTAVPEPPHFERKLPTEQLRLLSRMATPSRVRELLPQYFRQHYRHLWLPHARHLYGRATFLEALCDAMEEVDDPATLAQRIYQRTCDRCALAPGDLAAVTDKTLSGEGGARQEPTPLTQTTSDTPSAGEGDHPDPPNTSAGEGDRRRDPLTWQHSVDRQQSAEYARREEEVSQAMADSPPEPHGSKGTSDAPPRRCKHQAPSPASARSRKKQRNAAKRRSGDYLHWCDIPRVNVEVRGVTHNKQLVEALHGLLEEDILFIPDINKAYQQIVSGQPTHDDVAAVKETMSDTPDKEQEQEPLPKGMLPGGLELQEQLFRDFPVVFNENSLKMEEIPAHVERPVMPLRLKPNAVPQYRHPYKLTPEQLKILQETLKEMMEKGLLERSASQWGAPAFFVPKVKPNGQRYGWRLCIDLRLANSQIEPDRYTFPRADTALASLGGCTIFSALDLRDAWYTIRLRPEDREIVAISTPLGLFQPRTAVFGIAGAPSCWMRWIDKIFQDLMWDDPELRLLIYADDIMIATKKDLQHHDQAVRRVVERLNTYMLVSPPSKAQLFRTELEYLGHIVSTEGVRPHPSKLDAIKKRSMPRTLVESQSFLGLVNYYRKFSPRLATFETTLRKDMKACTKPNDPVPWSDQSKVAFEGIKQEFTSPPLLLHPNPDLPYTVVTDASDTAYGGFLAQDPDGNGLRPVEYFSKTWSGSEVHWDVRRKEAYAIIHALQVWRHYLLGVRFTVWTDHRSLETLLSQRAFKGRSQTLLRYLDFLAEYDFHVHYIRGDQNHLADYLSRPPKRPVVLEARPDPTRPLEQILPDGSKLPTEPLMSVEDTVASLLDLLGTSLDEETAHDRPEGHTETHDLHVASDQEDQCTPRHADWVSMMEHIPPTSSLGQGYTFTPRAGPILAAIQSAAPEFQEIRQRFWNEFISAYPRDGRLKQECERRPGAFYTHAGLIFHRRTDGPDAICVPGVATLREKILMEAHDSPCAGHKGYHATLSSLQRRWWWPGMKGDVADYVRTCASCQANKNKAGITPQGHMHEIEPGTEPWGLVTMDIIGPLPTTRRGHSFALVIKCTLTKEAIYIPMRGKSDKDLTPEGLADLWLYHVFSWRGVPRRIITDRGSAFISEFWRHLHAMLGTSLATTTAFRPQGDGHSERQMTVLAAGLRHFVSFHQDDWDRYLPLLQYANNEAIARTTGVRPYMAVQGWVPYTPADLMAPVRDEQHSRIWLERQHLALRRARRALYMAGQLRAESYDRSRRLARHFKVGDKALLSTVNFDLLDHQLQPDGKRTKKLAARWVPVTIASVGDHDTYRVILPPELTRRRIHDVFHVDLLAPRHISDPGRWSFRPLHLPAPPPGVESPFGLPAHQDLDDVEAIIGAAQRKERYRSWYGGRSLPYRFYLIRRVHDPMGEHDCWLPRWSLRACSEIVAQYERDHPDLDRRYGALHPERDAYYDGAVYH